MLKRRMSKLREAIGRSNCQRKTDLLYSEWLRELGRCYVKRGAGMMNPTRKDS